MIDLDTFKKSLGVLAQELSEDEILDLRDSQDRLADVLLSSWISERKKNNVS